MGYILTYKQELKKSMDFLGGYEKSVFIGQGMIYGEITGTLKDIPDYKKIEFPVAEDMQMGVSIGIAISGYLPITIYPRMDFLILSINQLVNHLDKLEYMSKGEFNPKVIIRCIVGSKKPLHPGEQHCQDHTDALKLLVKNIDVVKLTSKDMILPAYKNAFESNKSTILIEMKELYDTE